ncbi:MAG: hypothetical protein M9932_06950 [Xanthobacteraceae bacterium]|nr:hypothetical protein [Xanthobacteraceae bacterium]
MAVLFKFKKSHSGIGTFRVIDQEGQVLSSCSVTNDRRFARSMFELRKPTSVRLEYFSEHANTMPTVLGIGLRRIAMLPDSPTVQINENSVCAAIATYPGRRNLLQETVESLLPQVDYLFVYLNNYRAPPDFLLEHPKIQYTLDTASTFRAAAKFFWIERFRCFWLICDDDIIYPPDYARRMIETLSKYGRSTIIGCHGTVFSPIFSNCYASRIQEYQFERALPSDRRVHMLGSGTMCLHSDTLASGDAANFLGYPTENDEIVAITCLSRNIRQIAIARQAGWIQSNPKMTYGIYEEVMLDVDKQRKVVEILSKGNPWPHLD